MELSLESIFSSGEWVGHLSYLLLVLSMLMRHIGALRALAISSALAGIGYDLFWLRNPVGVFWETLLLAVNVGQLLLMRWETRRATFSAEEAALVGRVVGQLSPRLQRKLLDVGVWADAATGDVLTREGHPVERLAYIANGEALISLDGIGVAACHDGAFVGEMTVLTGDAATGTAVVSMPSRTWSIDARTLRALVAAEPEILSALREGFAGNLREKLVAANVAALEALKQTE